LENGAVSGIRKPSPEVQYVRVGLVVAIVVIVAMNVVSMMGIAEHAKAALADARGHLQNGQLNYYLCE
jgi:hypothetical protein